MRLWRKGPSTIYGIISQDSVCVQGEVDEVVVAINLKWQRFERPHSADCITAFFRVMDCNGSSFHRGCS